MLVPQLTRNTIGLMNEFIHVAELPFTGRLSILVLKTESFGKTMQPARVFCAATLAGGV